MRKVLFIFASLLLFAASAFAHEYWLEPEKFALAPGEKTVVRLYVGDALKDKEEKPFQTTKTTRFDIFSANKTLDLKTSVADGAMPIYGFSADKAGNYLLAMERNWSYIKLNAQEFEDYLREDGMEYIIAEREKLGERKKEGSERYSRFLKSLLQVGTRRDDVYKKQLGMKLEIVPLENPYTKKVGDKLKFQVFLDGKPLADRDVFANNRNGENVTTQKMKTDKSGKIAVSLDNGGLWLVRLVNMQKCRQDCGEADWESFWAAFTFGV
jgi:uncharacterized GH25 family protein